MSIWTRPSTLFVERVFGKLWRSTDAQESSSPSSDNSTMEWWPESKTTERPLNPSQSLTEWNKAVCLLPPCQFSLVFSALLTDPFRGTDTGPASNTDQIDQPSTSGGFKRKPFLPTTVLSTLPRKPPCSTALTSSLTPALTSAWPSVRRRRRWCISQLQASRTLNQASASAVSNWTRWTSSPTLAALFPKTLSIDDEANARLAKASVAFGRLHKNVWNRRGSPHYFMTVKHGRSISAMPENWTTITLHASENSWV